MSGGASAPTAADAAADSAVDAFAPADGGHGGTSGDDGGLHPDSEARMATALTLLRSHFGHSAFRPGQEAVLRILLTDAHGGSAVAIFPTSAGKSLCYQLPALVYPTGLTLVVSPLLALIKDQVDGLVAKGIPAANLDSTLDGPTVRDVYSRVRDGSLRLLFVAPERFKNDRFRQLLRSVSVELLAIDEAHCVSEWGQAFRPDYLRLARAAVEVGAVRRLALTATATDAVAADIAKRFHVRPTAVLRTPFRRANLTTLVTTVPRRPPLPPGRAAPAVDDHRVNVLAVRLRSQAPGRTIVYVTLQKGVAALAAALGQTLGPSGGMSIRAYHAGLPADERTEVQEWFSGADPSDAPAPARVIVCTIAFGMGVDVCDIRYVYHFNAPKSLENYVQEIGRAGRDGKPSTAEMLLCTDDVPMLEGFAYGSTPSAAAVRALVAAVFPPGVEPGATVDLSLYDTCVELDTKDTAVNQLLASMDLNGGYVREGTPFFDEVTLVHPPAGAPKVRLSSADTALLATATIKRTNTYLNVTKATEATAFTVDEVHRRVNALVAAGAYASTTVRKVRSRFRIIRVPDDPDALARRLHAGAVEREQREIARCADVMAFAAAKTCMTAALARRFGSTAEAAAVAAMPGGCGHCGVCLERSRQAGPGGGDGATVDAAPSTPLVVSTQPSAADVDERRWALVTADAVGVPRDDPSLLARFACGISSPRLMRLRLSRHRLFGVLSDTDYRAVLAAAEAFCGGGCGVDGDG